MSVPAASLPTLAGVDAIVRLLFELIASLVGAAVAPDGSRERRRRFAEMWEQRCEFPARRRSERVGWVNGSAYAEQGTLWFTSSYESSAHKLEVADVQVGGRGPAMFGHSRVLRIVTREGHHVEFAVLARHADQILATLLPVRTVGKTPAVALCRPPKLTSGAD